MDRATEAYTHMGGEGANWIGEAPFSTRKHVFQNLGEGTYNHSGIMAIRAARRCQGQHHLQDPLQRCRRHDRRSVQRGRA
jgi:TPP-dependent indolepyruvate ferredoxin oxidoreductase alpha subunit